MVMVVGVAVTHKLRSIDPPKNLGLNTGPQRPLFEEVDTDVAPGVKQIDPGLILELMQPPIVFHRAFVDMTGSVTAALMLSHSLPQSDKADSLGWFDKSQEAWTLETGLSRFEQQTAKRVLVDLKILYSSRRGMPARTMYRIDIQRVMEMVQQYTQSRWSSQGRSLIPYLGGELA
jgi:hypothetical protein